MMAILNAARPFPVLGRGNDYSVHKFEKTITVDPASGSINVSNPSNRVNQLFGGQVGDFLLVENAQTAFREFTRIDADNEVVKLNLAKLLGITKITLVQVALEELGFSGVDEFNSFFKDGFTWGNFNIRAGEVLGFGETQILDIEPKTGSNWLIFSDSKEPGYKFEITQGRSGKVNVRMGRDLFALAMLGMSDVYSKNWAKLAFAKPALEYAIVEALTIEGVEEELETPWQEALRVKLGGYGILDISDLAENGEVQKLAMKMLEDEVLVPLGSEVSERAED